MDPKDTEFLKRLQETFRVEAEEHINAITAGLFDLEKTPETVRRLEVIEAVFREVHSLKGAARSVNLRDIESICQPLESAFALLKRQELALSPALFDLFHKAVDQISLLVKSQDTERLTSDRSHTRELIEQLGKMSRDAGPHPGPVGPEPAVDELSLEVAPSKEVQIKLDTVRQEGPSIVETVRIPTSRLDSLLLQAEGMTFAKMASAQRAAELQEINHAFVSWKAESAKWKDRQSADRSPLWNEWLEWNEARLSSLQTLAADVARAAQQDQHMLKQMVDEHLEVMKKVLMLPVSSIVAAFPKFARDVAHDQGKEVDLVIRGADIEIDKRILEELKDPLIHIIRNCIDHGIEKPEERTRRDKPPRGTIMLTFVTKDSRRAEILVSDDGEGIDLDRVRSTAIKTGILSRDAAAKLNFRAALSLIFQSGISTSPIITDISGRGLGLAIVREKVEKLGGVVSVDTRAHVGTTFHLLLPLTLATFRGVPVRVDDQVFVLPTTSIEHIARVSQDEIRTVENRETLRLDGQILSTVRLADALEMPVRNSGHLKTRVANVDTTSRIPVVILASGEKRVAFQVDEVLAEQEVLVKELGRQLSRVRNIAGATVLGTGRVAAVLNVADLIESAVRSEAAARAATTDERAAERKGRILVAEDSITSRTLLKNILETAGLQVATAVDGVDAFTQLRSGEFDMLVSDVDMPRMSGFELTTKIRNDKTLGELPVVLVTALESREDRERGIDVGANAYIVKSSFDQSNLLQVVRRLI